ncbi:MULTISPECIES: MT-A70 family methyltransferase [unclassified Bradyrhizobium]|uniref:MT-A70 family methyltransferase n=1 Tax=unclassified Bradyrhizobium TaxID=2631580 RepID=UPI0028E60CB0|nr:MULTISPECIES: MT-A70 family methyltransferase [unclassified Bradyrhizobium]
MTFAFHPYAELFPLIEGADFYDLAEDIRINGLKDRIILIGQGDAAAQILDGRNRYRALVWIMSTGEGVGPGWSHAGLHEGDKLQAADILDVGNRFLFRQFAQAVDGDPLDFVLSRNLHRRQMSADERRMVGARLVTLRQGRPEQTSQSANISREQAAKITQADVAGIDRARSVIAHAAPEIVEAASRGKISVAAAAEIAAQPIERQAQIVASLPRDAEGKLTAVAKKMLAPVIKEIRRDKIAAKKERREEREAEFGRKIQALPDRMFGVAIEDFEWDHETWSAETGTERHPSMHYETAAEARTPEEIVARCAERFACLADDCILFKWTTIPHLAVAIKVMELQGFTYVTHLVWDKRRMGEARGMGYWFTGEHEIVLVGVRGKVVPPATAHFRSVFTEPVGAHSEKPDNIHRMIEFHWPNVPKVEFNARRRRPGWEAWGFDAPRENVQFADSGESESLRAADLPAPPVPPPAPEDGIVELAPVDRDIGVETAVPPAGRPGSNSPGSGFPDLEIPPFLRRTSSQTAAEQSEMDLARRDRLPGKVVDGHLQTRLALTSDELEMQAALRAIDAGEAVEWSITRHLIGAGFAHATTKRLLVTDEGRDFLAQLVQPVLAAAAEVRP